jgi:hypothetical protein
LECALVRRAKGDHMFVFRTCGGDGATIPHEAFPDNAAIRRDDVAKAMVPVLEVNQKLTNYLKEEKIRGKYWIRDFADLIVDRTWDAIQ